MERLVARLGEGVMAHSLAVFTRGGDLTREGGSIEELLESAPASLKQLLARMGHGEGTGNPPVLIENFPSDGSSRSEAAAAPLLAAVRALVARRAAAMGVVGPGRVPLDSLRHRVPATA